MCSNDNLQVSDIRKCFAVAALGAGKATDIYPNFQPGLSLFTDIAMHHRRNFSLSSLLLRGGLAAFLVAPPLLTQAAPAGAHRFDVYEYAVSGVSLLPEARIETAVMPFLGEEKSIEDVQGARQAVEEAYRAAGYLTAVVSIPSQPTDGGVIQLRVTEGEVERLRVKGAEYHLPSDIRDKIGEFSEGKVPHFPTMQGQMAELNRGSDLRVTPVLRAGKTPGKVEVDLEVEDQLPFHASLDWNNRYSANTTKQRLGVSLRYDNLWQAGHSIGFTGQFAPERPSDTKVMALSYSLPMARDTLAFYAVRSRSSLSTLNSATALGTLGNSDIYGLRWVMPLANAGIGGFYHSLSLGVDYKEMHQAVTLASGQIETPVNYMPYSLAYSANWQGEAGAVTTLETGAVFSLRGALSKDSDQFAARRQGADASFFALRLGASRQQPLGGGWLAYGKVDSQLASQPLISSEQFVGAGAEAVRGYLESERLGDSGLRTTLELRAPAFNAVGSGVWLTPALFYDIAELHVQQAVYPQKNRYLLHSTGLSLRGRAPYGLRLETDLAFALSDGDQTRAGDYRLLARLLWDY